MKKVVLSTVGTSLLTQQIDRKNPNENDWYAKLRDTANLTLENTPEEIKVIIESLKERAIQKLEGVEKNSIKKIREASAELNGIYGIYDENLDQARSDMHWLIATDTAQGRATAAIVENFLRKKGISAQTFTPEGLSAASTQAFTEGIDELLTWLDSALQGYDYIYFNLVGGFKLLQGYLNSIGMFHADEIIYIFEGDKSELIRIPRLPIKIDHDTFKDNVLEFALMAAGAWLDDSKLDELPDSLFLSINNERTLSNWGRLLWNQVKSVFLSQDLLSFPRISYQPSFLRDYEEVLDVNQRIKLQEVLAKISYLLDKNQGNTGCLKEDAGLLYEVYTNKGGIAHFRVTQRIRVSCVSEDGKLLLRRYGIESKVNGNP